MFLLRIKKCNIVNFSCSLSSYSTMKTQSAENKDSKSGEGQRLENPRISQQSRKNRYNIVILFIEICLKDNSFAHALKN